MLYCILANPILYSHLINQGMNVFARTEKGEILDRIAIGLSGLCAVHCLATTILVALLASVGGVLASPAIHETGLTLAIIVGVIALGRGIVVHGFMLPAAIGGLGLGTMAGALSLPHGGAEAAYTVIGVAIVALGHDLNRRAAL
jgi:hypothetical protein